jgi:hypothetical protein
MRTWGLLSLLLVAGCQTSSGSLGYDKPGRGSDISIAEQKARGRERYPLIEDDKLTVKTYVDRPDPSYSR